MSLTHTWRRRATVLMFSAVLATTGVGLGSVPAMASSESASAVVGDPEVVLVAPVSGASVSSGDLTALGLNQAPELPPGLATASLLGPIDALNCNTLKRASHVVTTYQARSRPGFSGGRIKLECGTEKGYGYRHIRAGHQGDWTRKMEPMRGNWDDFMDFATRQSLVAPSKIADQGGGKLCYTTPVQVRNSKGQVLKTFYPRVIISKTNRRVITLYPARGC